MADVIGSAVVVGIAVVAVVTRVSFATLLAVAAQRANERVLAFRRQQATASGTPQRASLVPAVTEVLVGRVAVCVVYARIAETTVLTDPAVIAVQIRSAMIIRDARGARIRPKHSPADAWVLACAVDGAVGIDVARHP